MKQFKKQYKNINDVWNDIEQGKTIHWSNDSYKLYVSEALKDNEYQHNHHTFKDGKVIYARCISNQFGSLLEESELPNLYSYSNFKTIKDGPIDIVLYRWNDPDRNLDFTAYIDIETVLENLERVTNLEELAESKDVDMHDEQDVVEFLEEMTAYQYVSSDNSYNWESDFSSNINFSILSADKDDWLFSSGYLVIRIHQGGDIRGNYSKCRIYKYHGEDETIMFLDSASVEVRFDSDEEIEQYTAGYQNNPLFHFNEDFKVYGVRDDGTILCKRKEDGKRFKAYLTNRAIY